MKYPIYHFLVIWTVSGIFAYVGLYLLDFNFKEWLAFMCLVISLSNYEEATKTVDEK